MECDAYIQSGFLRLSEISLETYWRSACPESHLLGNSKSCQIDKMNYHRYVDISKLEIKDYVKLFW